MNRKILTVALFFGAALTSQAGDLGGQTVFKRGDANDDGSVTGADASYIANYLYQGGPEFNCEDAADANDDGTITGADSSYIMSYLFSGGSAPPSPFPDCGEDPTKDSLGCESSACE